MKKILILIMTMSLLLISFASAETTIIDNADNTIIGSVGGGSGLIRTITFEYNKPLGQIDNASVQLKIGKTPTTNYSIPQSCLDRSVLSFQYRVDTATFTPATTNYYCTNTTNGLELITSRNNFSGDTNTPGVTTFGEQARAYDNDYNTGVLGYNFEFYFAPTTAISNSQRADSVFYEQDLILEHTGSLTLVCDGSFSQQPCYIPSGYTLNLDPGTHTINQTLYIDDGVTINGNGATLLTSVSAPIRINGSNTNINNLNINGSVNGAILIQDTASNGVIDNVNCDVDLYCVRFLGGNNFDVTNINGEALVIQNANDVYVDNYVMNANIVSSVSSFSITDSTNIFIENSDFTGVDSFGDGFYIAGISTISENITLRNNVFNDVTTIYSTEFGFLGSTNIVLENNTFNSPITTSATNVDFINNNYNTNTFSNTGTNTSLFQNFGDFTSLNYPILNAGTFNPTDIIGNETSLYIPPFQALNTTANIFFSPDSLDEIILKDGLTCNALECANFFNDGSAILSFDISSTGTYERVTAKPTAFKDKFVVFNDFENTGTDNYTDYLGDKDFINCASVSTGIRGSSQTINIDDNKCLLKNYDDLDYIQENHTIGFWLNTDINNPSRIYQSGGSISAENTSYFLVSSNLGSLTNYFNNAGGTSITTSINPSNIWRHIVITYENNITTIYLDGQETALTGTQNQRPLAFGNITDTFQLGIAQFGNQNANDVYMDDFFIYDGKLSVDDIVSLKINSTNYIDSLRINNLTPQSFNINPLLLENTTNGSVYETFNYLTLSSTGNNIEFSYSESDGFPIPYYNVYLSNGALNFSIRTNTSFFNFIENIDRNDLITGNYNVIVESFNDQGNFIAQSVENYDFCVNNWNAIYTTCVNDTQIKTYIDANTCAEQYDLPIDNGTNVACDDQITSVEELEERNTLFKENLLIMLWILIMGVALIFFYVMSRSALSGMLVTAYFFLLGIYLFIQFPNDWIVGVGSLIIGSAFGLSSWIMNKEV